jgi:SAM-dependent methyltransferase
MSYEYTSDPGIYDRVTKGVSGDAAFYAEEARRGGGPYLEFGCGTGRILFPVAEAGIRVTGVDVSPEMLAQARTKAAALPQEVRERITLHEGDLRSFSHPSRFMLIAVPFRTFLHMLTTEDQLAALANIRRHLLPGGRAVIDFLEPSRLISELVGPGSSTRGVLRQTGTVTTHPETGNTLVEWSSMTGDYMSQRITFSLVYDELDAEGQVIRRLYRRIESRFIFRMEFEHLLYRAGFQLEALYGSFDRGPVRPGGELIWVASAG